MTVYMYLNNLVYTWVLIFDKKLGIIMLSWIFALLSWELVYNSKHILQYNYINIYLMNSGLIKRINCFEWIPNAVIFLHGRNNYYKLYRKLFYVGI